MTFSLRCSGSQRWGGAQANSEIGTVLIWIGKLRDILLSRLLTKKTKIRSLWLICKVRVSTSWETRGDSKLMDSAVWRVCKSPLLSTIKDTQTYANNPVSPTHQRHASFLICCHQNFGIFLSLVSFCTCRSSRPGNHKLLERLFFFDGANYKTEHLHINRLFFPVYIESMSSYGNRDTCSKTIWILSIWVSAHNGVKWQMTSIVFCWRHTALGINTS